MVFNAEAEQVILSNGTGCPVRPAPRQHQSPRADLLPDLTPPLALGNSARGAHLRRWRPRHHARGADAGVGGWKSQGSGPTARWHPARRKDDAAGAGASFEPASIRYGN